MRGAFFAAASKLLEEGGGGVEEAGGLERLERPHRAGLRLERNDDLGVVPEDEALSLPEEHERINS